LEKSRVDLVAYPSQIQLSETRDEIGFECKLRLANSSYKSKK
jgi:hypothetical protein